MSLRAANEFSKRPSTSRNLGFAKAGTMAATTIGTSAQSCWSDPILPFIGVFALLEDGCPEVWLTKRNGLVGIERSDSDEEVKRFKRFRADDLVRRFAYSGTATDRNQHMMSGRVR